MLSARLPALFRPTTCAPAVAALTLTLAPVAHAHDAHVHGAARLDVVMDGSTLTAHFASPLANVLGFEHAPRAPAEIASARRAIARLRDGPAMLATSPAAGCVLNSVRLDFGALSPAFDRLDGTPAPASSAATAGDGHADLDAEYVFQCRAPAALRQIDVRLFGAFPALRRIDVQQVTPGRQARHVLTPEKARLSW